MLRCIKYVLDLKDMGLKIEPTGTVGEPWVIVCFTESDHVQETLLLGGVSLVLSYMSMEYRWYGEVVPISALLSVAQKANGTHFLRQ